MEVVVEPQCSVSRMMLPPLARLRRHELACWSQPTVNYSVPTNSASEGASTRVMGHVDESRYCWHVLNQHLTTRQLFAPCLVITTPDIVPLSQLAAQRLPVQVATLQASYVLPGAL